jgi:hypothetical protein
MRKQLTPHILPPRRNGRGDLKSRTSNPLSPKPRTSPHNLQVATYKNLSFRLSRLFHEIAVLGGVPGVIGDNAQSNLDAMLSCFRAGESWQDEMDQSEVDR